MIVSVGNFPDSYLVFLHLVPKMKVFLRVLYTNGGHLIHGLNLHETQIGIRRLSALEELAEKNGLMRVEKGVFNL